MTHSSKFWDWMASRYAKQAIADETAYQKKLSLAQQYFDINSRLLEFGCGTGSTAIHHAQAAGHIHATDISSKMLAIAETKAKAAGLNNISFEQTDLLELKSANQSWDAIFAMSILHLVADKEAEIKKTYELLKPGGVFISSTICIGDSGIGFKLLAFIFKFIPLLPSIVVFSQEQLIETLESTGFSIETNWQPDENAAVFIVARKPR